MPLAAELATRCAIGAVRTYQWTLRPVIGPNCRFWPSCSDYAIEAFREHGALTGGALTVRRILRCNPWHAGGVDLVPKRDGTILSPGRGGTTSSQGPGEHSPGSDRVEDKLPRKRGVDNDFVSAGGRNGPSPARDERARGSQMGH